MASNKSSQDAKKLAEKAKTEHGGDKPEVPVRRKQGPRK